MAFLTREQKSDEIMRLEILLAKMKQENQSFNQQLQILRKIQKLRDKL
jgi:hypothetical protein